MSQIGAATTAVVNELVESWGRYLLMEEDKTDPTIKAYLISARQFARWCQEHYPANHPVLTKPVVSRFLHSLAEDRSQNTIKVRLAALRRFSAWLTEIEEQDRDRLKGMGPPKGPASLPRAPLTGTQADALLKTCRSSLEFRDLRDDAIIRLMTTLGLYPGELLGMKRSEVDRDEQWVVIHRTRTGREELRSLDPVTSYRLHVYLRRRRRHELASTDYLWLGEHRTFGYTALVKSLQARADRAGIEKFCLTQLTYREKSLADVRASLDRIQGPIPADWPRQRRRRAAEDEE